MTNLVSLGNVPRSLWLASLLATAASAQVYGSGSLGALAPSSNLVLNTAVNGGVFDYTSINIPAGVTVRLTGFNPAILLCTGSVTIAGTLDASGFDTGAPSTPPGAGGPGGYPGGGSGAPGGGPGGGPPGFLWLYPMAIPGGMASHATLGQVSTSQTPGPTYGAALPFDLRGGSGGGGPGFISFSIPPIAGAGGGGTVVLLAAGPINVSGTIRALGGSLPTWFTASYGGPGAGGSILLRSLQSVQITGTVDARAGGPTPGNAGAGFIRIDSYSASGAPNLGGSTILPAPFVAPLPFLTALAPAHVGQVFPIRCASAPGDVMSLYVSLGTAQIPVPPVGVIELDPTWLWFFGEHTVPTSGHDPLAALDIPIPNESWLIGITFYAQAVNSLATVAGMPRLSNLLPIPIGP